MNIYDNSSSYGCRTYLSNLPKKQRKVEMLSKSIGINIVILLNTTDQYRAKYYYGISFAKSYLVMQLHFP